MGVILCTSTGPVCDDSGTCLVGENTEERSKEMSIQNRGIST